MKLADVFSSDMVFAANKPIRIFGNGQGSATVTFAGTCQTVVSHTPTWCVEFAPMEYGGPYTLAFSSDGETVTLERIYIGEVYLFAGQSNMSFSLQESNTDKALYETNDKLHYLAVSPSPSPIAWSCAMQSTVGDWSALGYLAGREIAAKKDVHVGIIVCATGASVIESWMPAGALERIGIQLSKEDKYFDHFYEKYASWNVDGALYGDKLMRVIPLAISGVVWYQGESDASEAEGKVYEQELCEMIRLWREAFANDKLPFCIVQIADCESRIAMGPGWKLVQDAQQRISTHVPNTFTVISRDICETDEIHPPTKDGLANRIASVIEAHFFGCWMNDAMNDSFFEQLRHYFVIIRYQYGLKDRDQEKVDNALASIRQARNELADCTQVQGRDILLYCIDQLFVIVAEGDAQKVFDYTDAIHNIPELCMQKRTLRSFCRELKAFRKKYGKTYFPF